MGSPSSGLVDPASAGAPRALPTGAASIFAPSAARVLGLAVALAAGFGIACGPAHADERASAAGSKEPASALQADVTDDYDIVVAVRGVGIFVADSGLMGGGRAKAVKQLRLWHGAHEIEVDLAQVTRIDVHLDQIDERHDLVWVTVTLKSGASQKGKVERALEVRGTIEFGTYKIRIDRAKRIVFKG